MSKNEMTMPTEEKVVHDHHHHLICWKSVLAGLFVSLTAFILLSSLGAGVAGFTAENLINKEEGGTSFATGAGLWLGVSIVISLFCGSYFTVRIARFMTSRIGAANGVVVASVFFVVMAMGAGHIIGGVAQGLGRTVIISDSNSTQPNSTANSTAKADSAEVAHATGDTGILVSVIVLLGLIAAGIGGRTGAHTNFHRPFAKASSGTNGPAFGGLGTQRGSALPYVFGWLLGVPVSVLFLIAILRSIF